MHNTIIAAITYEESADKPTVLLWSIVNNLLKRGVRVGGLLNKCTPEGNHVSEVLQSVSDAREYVILQCLGKHSASCKLDPVGLAKSSEVLREAIEQHVDLLIVNKYGIAEAEGRGFLDEYATAIAANIPIISLVEQKYLEFWQQFTGYMGIVLPCDLSAVTDWIDEKLRAQASFVCAVD